MRARALRLAVDPPCTAVPQSANSFLSLTFYPPSPHFDSWRGLICHPAGDESDASPPDLCAAANEI